MKGPGFNAFLIRLMVVAVIFPAALSAQQSNCTKLPGTDDNTTAPAKAKAGKTNKAEAASAGTLEDCNAPGRIWTNDDARFRKTATVPLVVGAQPVQQPVLRPTRMSSDPDDDTVPQVTPARGPELQQARQEAVDDMLTRTRGRQEAYDQFIDMISIKLQTEHNSFRVEVYRELLNNAWALKEVNGQLLQKLSPQIPASEEPSKP